MDWNRLPLLNYQQMISPITQIHIKHMRHCPRPARAYLGARQQESLKCNSSERIGTARKFAAAAHMIRLRSLRHRNAPAEERHKKNRHQPERLRPYPLDFRYFFLRAPRSEGSSSTEPMTSATASSNVDRFPRDRLVVRRSRTTSDFESRRRCDSALISAIRSSGNRTVRVFMARVYSEPADVQYEPLFAPRTPSWY